MSDALLAQLAGVKKSFGEKSGKITALDGFDLEVRPGELLALLGPNGAGKSTAISLMLGLQQPDAGTARLFGRPPLEIEARRHIGVMMQEVALAPELKVREQIELIASYYPNPLATEEVLTKTNTTALAARPYGKLSAGQKRQAQFSLALCGRPSLLFLDEPTVGLDIQARTLMWAALRQLVREGCSIVLTTHYLEEAEALADRVVVLARGKSVASGTVGEMRAIVGRKHITCMTSLPPDVVTTWPGVQSVSREAGRLSITASDADSVVRRLVESATDFSGLEVRSAGLAEAFTELTSEGASEHGKDVNELQEVVR
jgi:ABC-2 type transport system ATP-binding protein